MDLTSAYELDRGSLAEVERAICHFLAGLGVRVSQVSLDQVVETSIYSEVYHVDRALKDEDAHHETCVSDGLEVWLHDEVEHVGGECSRLYDLLHVGCGHLVQWAAGPESGLEFFGDEAWLMASTFFLGRPEEEIQRVWRYEREAAQLANGNLRKVLELVDLEPAFEERLAAMFNDYATTDLAYITAYYRTGEVRGLFEGWQTGAPVIEPISTDFALRPTRRSNKCVALLSKRNV